MLVKIFLIKVKLAERFVLKGFRRCHHKIFISIDFQVTSTTNLKEI